MRSIYQGHLTGSRPPIGIYPVVKMPAAGVPIGGVVRSWFAVKFGAVDIDEQDPGLAANLWKALAALDIAAWVEKSRSKGYHVWVFAAEWVPAVLMRSVLQVACDVVGYNPKEIYPKQTELADGSPGNYIRLPYPGGLGKMADKSAGRVVLDLETPERDVLPLELFVLRAWENRCSRSVLESAASLAKPPKVRTRLVRESATTAELNQILSKISGKPYTIWRDGPLEGSDRSSTLYKLAHLLREEGLVAGDAFLVLQNADERWGKFSDRPDGEARLWEILEKAYG